ncbi:glycosyltransferase family 2 protein [Nioella aestuarii]|uniref:glycosyltransferase family 2 protein n=1 Tax=Nioella aestuarii TaxID=1662864 RepID=UPI003D7FACC2
MISVIIPAHNEAGYIGKCLDAVLASRGIASAEVIVAANGCTDETAQIAESYAERFAKKGWRYCALDIAAPGKTEALNKAEVMATYPMRLFLDADVLVTPGLIAGIAGVLDRPEPAYASGMIVVTGEGATSRAYARFWARLPFMATGVPGCGVFAVNGLGRARWSRFPDIIADDYYVRLLFSPSERHLVPAEFDWPVAEGFYRLVKVRRRQNAGVAEIAHKFPELMTNEEIIPPAERSIMKLAGQDLSGFLVYGLVAFMCKILPAPKGWDRGR